MSRLLHGSKAERRLLLHAIVQRIELHSDRLEVEAQVPALDEQIGASTSYQDGSRSLDLKLTIPVSTVRAGREVRLLMPPSPRSGNGRQDAALIALVAKAWTARQALTSTAGMTVDEAAAGMGLKADYFRVLVRISFLAPDIVAAILEGRQPGLLTRQKLARMNDFPLEWEAQRAVLGFPSELREAA